MPIFRILGGSHCNSSSNNRSSSSSSRSFLGGNGNTNNNNSNSNASSNNHSNESNQSNQRTSTYPGLRIQRNSSNRSNTHNNGGIGIGVGSNTSRGLFSSINSGSTNSVQPHDNNPYVSSSPLHTRSQVIVQGSSIPSTAPPSSASGHPHMSAPRGGAMPTPPSRDSVGSGVQNFTGTTAPYVNNNSNSYSSTRNSNFNSNSNSNN